MLYVLIGAIADAIDGRVARATRTGTRFGEELDSLVDAISFGLAPAMIMYFAVLLKDGWDWLFVFGFTACAVIRLARFNVITNPLLHRDAKDSHKDFVGLPVPAAAGTVASLVLALLQLEESGFSLHRWALALPPLLALIAILIEMLRHGH